MSTILWLEWKHFYVDSSSKGFALVVRDDTILDANAPANSLGVEPGTSLRQAKSLCQGARITKWNPDDYAAKQKLWLDVCTEYTGKIEPIDQHIAALDLSDHPDPTDIAE